MDPVHAPPPDHLSRLRERKDLRGVRVSEPALANPGEGKHLATMPAVGLRRPSKNGVRTGTSKSNPRTLHPL